MRVLLKNSHDFLDKNKVYEIQLKKPLPSRSIGYTYLKRRSLSQATLKFIELIDQFDKSI